MDIAFSENCFTGQKIYTWSSLAHTDIFSTLLQKALVQATSQGHVILASCTVPLAPCDPLQVFRGFQLLTESNCFFWARPAEQHALVGWGEAKTIETHGSGCVNDAARVWRELQQDAVVEQFDGPVPSYTSGPVLFGGFAFDPLTSRTDLWRGFPDGLLVLPALLFHCDETRAALTLNVLIQPEANIEHILGELQARIKALEQALIQVERLAATDNPTSPATASCILHDLLPADSWKRQVALAVEHIQQGKFEKVVLARGVQVVNEDVQESFDVAAILQRLRESYPTAYVFALQRQDRYFIGATPERLLCGTDGQIQTMALAGSAPRSGDEVEDQRLGSELLQSVKNQDEHRFVVTTICKALESLCSRVWVADAPHLLKLKNIQHLETPIMGDLLPGHSILEAIEDLHPTPAVGGTPRSTALEAIRELEHLDRGWYAGPIGWIGVRGNGEFAVALRSALLHGRMATLFAGCGIVADSVPESEYQESCWKLQVMLRGLGCEGE